MSSNRADHEARVTAFLAAAKRDNPLHFRLVCSLYPVKSRWQMERIGRQEKPVGLDPTNKRKKAQ